jgi:hypothetical protein
MLLKEWLTDALAERLARLVVQYVWTESGTRSILSIQGYKTFLSKYPGLLSEDIQRLWEDRRTFLLGRASIAQAVFETDRDFAGISVGLNSMLG